MKLLVFAALVFGILIGVGGTLAFYVIRPGPDAGDWLAFIGALVGVSVTILGTLWLQDFRANRGEREALEIYRKSLANLRTAMEAVVRERGNEEIGPFRADQISLEDGLLKEMSRFVFAQRFVPRRNIAAVHAAHELAEDLMRARMLLTKERDHIIEAGDNENVLRVNLSKMGQMYDQTEPFIEAAERSVR